MADKRECNINVAISNSLAVKSALENSRIAYPEMDMIVPTRLKAEVANNITNQDLHAKNPQEKTMFTDSKELIKYAKAWGLDENISVPRVLSALAIRTEDILSKSELKPLAVEINTVYEDAYGDYIDYLKDLNKRAENGGDVKDEIKGYDAFFKKHIGWKSSQKEFDITSDFYKYNEILNEIKNDEQRKNEYNYTVRWLNAITDGREKGLILKLIASGTKNIRTSLLKWNIASGISNSTQFGGVILPEIGVFGNTKIALKATSDWWRALAYTTANANAFGFFSKAANALGIPENSIFSQEEIEEFKRNKIGSFNSFDDPRDIIADIMEKQKLTEESEKDKPWYQDTVSWLHQNDIFQAFEMPNQISAYLAGKALAKKENPNLSDKELEKAGKYFNEKVNFITRGANMPEAFWDKSGSNTLALLSYTIQSTKLQTMHAIDSLNFSIDNKTQLKAADRLISSMIMNFVLFGNLSLPAFGLYHLIMGIIALGSSDDDDVYKKYKKWEAEEKAKSKFARGGLLEALLQIHPSASGKINIPDMFDFTPVFFDFTKDLSESITNISKDIEKIATGKDVAPYKVAKHIGSLLDTVLGMSGLTAKYLGIGQAQVSKIANYNLKATFAELLKDGSAYERYAFRENLKYANSRANELSKIFVPMTPDEAKRISEAQLKQINTREEKQEKLDIKKAFLEDRMDDYYDLVQQYADKYGKDFDEVTKNIEKGIKSSKTRRIKDVENDETLEQEEYEQKRDKIVEELFNDDVQSYEDYAQDKEIETGYNENTEEEEE